MKDESVVLLLSADEIDDLGALLNCAVRYSLGSESYMPRLVMEFIRRHPELLTPKSAGCMIRDLEEAKERPQTEWEKQHSRSAFGLDYQQDMWLEFLSWLQTRMKEMGKNG